jgi:hypothetical protein
MTRLSFLSCVIVCIFSCIQGAAQGFINSTTQYQIQHSILGAYNGSGLSCADFNQDGLDDVTLCSRNAPVKFYINQGGYFVLDTLVDHQGEVKAALWADIENDHDQDLLITTFEGYCKLYKNLGNLEFEDVSVEYGIPQDTNAMSYGASFGDFNRDGFLDLYICNYNWPSGNSNWLLQNDGNGHFQNISDSSPASDLSRRSFQSTFLDINNDLWSDLFVINDKQTRNSLYLNNQGVFEDITEGSNTGSLMESMSNSPCDFDHDGDLDIYITNGPIGNVFLRNDNGVFTDIAPDLNMTVGTLCWGALWIDYNADGWEDLYICDIFPYLGDANHWFKNNGDGTFQEVIPQGMNNDNFQSYANAIGDFNNDSRPDIMVVNEGGQYAVLWEYYSPNTNFLSVDLDGVFSNSDGVGAWLHVFSDGVEQHRFTMCGENYLAQNSSTKFFGLNTANVADSVIVEWPSGWIDRFYNLSANERHQLIEGSSLNHLLNLNDEIIICENDSVLLHSNLNTNITWSDGFVGNSRWITSEGEYFALAEPMPNWIVESNHVLIQFAPPISYSISTSHIDCFENANGIISITTNTDSIVWSNNDNGFMIDSLWAENYVFTLIDQYGCSVMDSAEITEPPLFEFSSVVVPPFNSQNGYIELNISGGSLPYTFDWNVGGNTSNLFNVQQGFYECIITDNNNCQLHFDTLLIDLGNDELQQMSAFRWNSESHVIEIPFYSHGVISVFDSKGSLIIRRVVNSNDSIDLSILSRGVYAISFLKSNVESFETTTKIVIE